VARLAGRSRSLADQLERAATSIALNLSEGNAVRDGNRKARFKNALGSAYETRSALKVAAAWGHIGEDEAARLDRALDCIAARTYRLIHR
jgi:four helix bundle protein